MVRSHGWQLPAHAFQVVAITVFFLLVVAYYVFFAPFVGSKPLEYGAIALYSPLALAVFFLYVRCTGINPADSGVLSGPDEKFGELNDMKGLVSESSGSVVHRQGSSEIPRIAEDSGERGLLSVCCGCLCGWAVVPDGCKGEPPPSTQLEEDVLYCTLCNAEVHKFSKHCRSCDKCVDGFDHHCRWLNNCVGKKNYSSFIALMASSLLLLALQCATGSVAFALCFTDKSATNRRIVEKLGNGFSRAPFAAVVLFCSFISAAAMVPLGELFCFHILLMRKGITTYEYVVAMRAQNEQQGGSVEDVLSVPSSPGSSTATGLTGSSSLGLQYRGAWCTPPRVFIEHQDEVIPHLEPGRVPSTVDPDSLPKDKKAQKRPVRLSAWKLAKLNASEAVKAAAKARENSSVMKQISGKGADADYSSSDIGSSRSSASTDFGLMRGKRTTEEGKFTASKLDMPRSRDDIHFDSGVTSSRSSISSPRHALDYSDGLSPLPSRPSYAPTGTLRLSTPRSAHDNTVRFSNLNPFSRPPRFSAPWAGGKFAPSDGSSVDSLDDRFLGTRQGNVKQNPVFSYIRQAWPDVDVGAENRRRAGTERRQQGRESPDVVDINENSRHDIPRKADDLLYPENSIFFGGPLIPGMSKPSASNQQGQQGNLGNLGNLPINAPTEQMGFRPVRGNPRSHSPVFNPPRFSNPGGFPPT